MLIKAAGRASRSVTAVGHWYLLLLHGCIYIDMCVGAEKERGSMAGEVPVVVQ